MGHEGNQNLTIINKSNLETLDYFNKTYVAKLELVQALKTELFELEVKIDELKKTRELYTYHNDSRRSLFSPNTNDEAAPITKGRQIELQIADLEEARYSLANRIEDIENELVFLKDKVTLLTQVQKSICTLLEDESFLTENIDLVNDGFEFLQDAKEEEKIRHGHNILMLQEFHNHQIAKKLDQRIWQNLISNHNKLEVLNWLLHSDLSRARITLGEIQDVSNSMLHAIEDILRFLNYQYDMKQPIWTAIDTLIAAYKNAYPNCNIEAHTECSDAASDIHPIITITLIDMLTEVLNNVFKHSNANKITAKIFISTRLVDVYINDNGVGIPNDYLERSKWHSGLHRLHELIYLLDGKIQIEGDLIGGTNVRFSFPL